MPKLIFVSKFPFRNWMRKLFSHNRRTKRPNVYGRRLCLEALEDRVVPAALTDDGTTITIALAANEQLTVTANAAGVIAITSSTNSITDGFTTSATYTGNATTGTITPGTNTQVVIVDQFGFDNSSVAFNQSSANVFTLGFNVSLTNATTTGGISFTGANPVTFNAGVSATTADGNVTSTAGSSLVVAAGFNLNLDATGGNISLAGAVTTGAGSSLVTLSGGDSTFSGVITSAGLAVFIANGTGGEVRADNASNDFQGTGIRLVDNGSNDFIIRDLNTLQFGSSATQVNGTLAVTAGSTISQEAGNTIRTFNTSTFTVLGAGATDSILLDQANDFSLTSPLNLSVAGATNTNDITVNDVASSNAGFMLGSVTFGNGNLGDLSVTLDTSALGFGAIVQNVSGIFTGGGDATFTINAGAGNDGDIQLASAANDIGGLMTFAQTGGALLRDLQIRNVNATPTIALSGFTLNDGTNDNVSFIFDNSVLPAGLLTGSDLNAINIRGALIIRVNGAIQATANPIQTNSSIGGSNAFTTLGSFSITLNNAANLIRDVVTFSVGGTTTAGVTFINNTDTTLGGVTIGTNGAGGGNLAITSNGDIIQTPSGTILMGVGATTFGTATFTATLSADSDIRLANAANNINGLVTLSTSAGGTVDDLQLRNISARASADLSTGIIAQLTNPVATVNDVIFFFDRVGLDSVLDFATGRLLTMNLTGDVELRVAGLITQAAASSITAAGNGTLTANVFQVFGNYGIDLDNTNNNFTDPITLSNPDADATTVSAVSLLSTNVNGITLNASTVGRSTLTVTATNAALTADIRQNGPIVQALGGGAVTFATLANEILLGDSNNVFNGAITLTGANLASVVLHNDSLVAAFPTITTPLTGTDDLSITFENAPVVLPTLTVNDLTVVGQGIMQVAGVSNALTVTGLGNFNANEFPLILDNNNDFQGVSGSGNGVQFQNSGFNKVAIRDNAGNLNFVGISQFNGSLTVTTNNGPITQNGGTASLVQGSGLDAAISFNAGSGTITLNGNNNFQGTVAIVGDTTILNHNDVLGVDANLLLGTIVIRNAGNLTITTDDSNGSNGGAISQAPGTSITVPGVATFDTSAVTGGGNITLNSAANNFVSVVFDTADNVIVRDASAIALGSAPSPVSVGGDLTVIAGGAITDDNVVTVVGSASFDAGAAAITLDGDGTDPNSDVFNELTVKTTAGSVLIRTQGSINDLNADVSATATFEVEAGLVAGGGIFQLGGGEGISAGNVTLDGGAGQSVLIDNPENRISGNIALNSSVNDLFITNEDDITFTGAPAITGFVELRADGAVILPNIATFNFNALTVSAVSIFVGNATTNINASAGGGIGFEGSVTFLNATGTTLTSAVDDISFVGNVSTAGPLTFDLTGGDDVNLVKGLWSQGSNNLTVTNGNLLVGIGAGNARLQMTGGAITLGNGDMVVGAGGTLEVVGGGAVVTVNNGAGDVEFDAGSTLLVALGSPSHGRLQVTGAGNVAIAPLSTKLRTTGVTVALDPASAVLQMTGSGRIVNLSNPSQQGFFANTLDEDGNPASFMGGSDIVLPAYTGTTITLDQGGTSATTGKFSIFQEDSDKVTVTTAAANGLAFVVDRFGLLNIVLRNAGATLANTISITTVKGVGDGLAAMGGIAVNGITTGSVSISAATANVDGDILVSTGRLASLTIRDMAGGRIQAGGANNLSTTITGRVFSTVDIDLTTVLSALTLKGFDGVEDNTITAERFGTIKITSDTAAGLTGDFDGNLVNRNVSGSTLAAIASANIAGQLSGDWDIDGNVTTIIARSTDGFNLGLHSAAGVVNGDQLNNVTTLNLGFAADTEVHAGGRITTITVKSFDSGVIHADSIGTITTTGDTTIGDVGNLEDVDIAVFGNNGGTARVALGTLNVKGSIIDGSLAFHSGNVTTIKAGRTIDGFDITGAATANSGSTQGSGNIGTIQASGWDDSTIDAKSVTTFKLIFNATLGLFGNFFSSGDAITLHGTGVTGNALGTFSVAGSLNGSSDDVVVVENGGIGAWSVGREMNQGTIRVLAGGITSISAGRWTESHIIARSIGTLKVNGAAALSPSSPALIGDFTSSSIYTYQTGTAASIGTFLVTGNLSSNDGSIIRADNGITSFTVNRAVTDVFISVVNSLPTSVNVGRVGSFSAGRIQNLVLVADTIGTFKTTGFTMAEQSGVNKVQGDIEDSIFIVHDGSFVAPIVGIGTLTVAGDFDDSTLIAPFGITTLTVNGRLIDAVILTANPGDATLGRITTLNARGITGTLIRANTIGTLKTTKATSVFDQIQLGQTGDVDGLELVVTGFTGTTSAPIGIGTLSIAGDLADSDLNVRNRITTLTVTELMGGNELAIGTAVAAGITTLTAGVWDANELITNNIGTFKVTGIVNGPAGTVDDSLFTITGASAGVALGSFTTTSTVSESIFNVAAGNVTTFSVGRFLSSDLLVGVHILRAANIATASNNGATNAWFGTATGFLIGTFITTGLRDTSATPNLTDTAGLSDSNVVAQRLGVITINSVNPLTGQLLPIFYGIGFRNVGGAAGTVTVAGAVVAPGATNGKFIRTNGLAG